MKRLLLSQWAVLLGVGLFVLTSVGCNATPAGPGQATPPAAARPTIRINAGGDEVKDKKGNVWAADTGFEGGTALPRPELVVAGAEVPEVASSEHYGMDSWSTKLPNGKYLLRLHFSENFDGNATEESRLFNYTVKDGDPATGKTIKAVTNFSPWKAAKARATEYIDSVPVEITKGQLSIKFETISDNSQIDGIEVIPQ
jgi:hypothetical protein